jgi:hypothetical protein
MNCRGILISFAIVSTQMTAMAQHHESPEAALSEYVSAYKARDVERFIAAIDFDHAAEEQLRRAARDELEPTESQIREKAAALSGELRDHLIQFGFRAATLDNCRSVTKFNDSETEVRIILSCRDSRGASAFPVRILRFSQGWRVVRGV